MFKCINCGWEGEELTDELKSKDNCLHCGDSRIEVMKARSKSNKPGSETEIPREGILAKIQDVVDDLKDDGKRNYSHDPKRKSPGRKPRAKKVNR